MKKKKNLLEIPFQVLTMRNVLISTTVAGHQNTEIGISNSRTSRGSKNWFEKLEFGKPGVKLQCLKLVKQMQGRQVLV